MSDAIIRQFEPAVTLQPIQFRRVRLGWSFKGQFQVVVHFNPRADCGRYEYRQGIQGIAFTQQGSCRDHRAATWHASGPMNNAGRAFNMPNGLTEHVQEDAEYWHGQLRHFGHRLARWGRADEAGLRDMYRPDQATGSDYEAIDTFGLQSERPAPEGLKIFLNIRWHGHIIDTQERDESTFHGYRVVTQQDWTRRGEHVVGAH